MQIKILNEYLDKTNYDLRFYQPKYWFGQLLMDEKHRSGVVVEMGYSTCWRYLLLEPQTGKLLDRYSENQLATTLNWKSQDATLLPLTVRIADQYLKSKSLNLEFTQPNYYFGQLLRAIDNLTGVVIQMGFNKGEWKYEILELTDEFPPLFDVYLEHQFKNLLGCHPDLLTHPIE